MSSWSEIERPHGQVKATRAREETGWRDLARILRPDDQNFDVSGNRQRTGDDSIDSTGLYAQDEFVGGMFGLATNPAESWFGLGIENTDLAKWGPVKQWLWNTTAIIRNSLDPAKSTFYLEASPWFADMAAFGNGFIWQEEFVGRHRIVERALPIAECFIAVDAAGEINRFHREFMLDDQQAKQWWGDRAPPMRDGERAKFVHAVSYNEDHRPGVLGRRGMRWKSCYVSPDKRDFYVERAYYELPVHEVMWNKRSGRVWATGPGHNALGDMRMLEEMQRSTLVGLQFAAEPMFAVQNEDIMTAADIQPHNVVYGGISENGKRLVEHIDRGDNLQLPMAQIERVRGDIRAAFLFGLMQVIKNRPQMTAAEFLGWKEENLKLAAPHLVRIHRGLSGFIGRRYGILQRANMIPPAPPELAEAGALKVQFSSPFEKAQKAEGGRGLLQWLGSLGQIATETQDPSILDNADFDAAARKLHDVFTGDPDVIRDPRVVAQVREQRAQAQQSANELQQAALASEVFANVAHGQQAQSAAKGRGKAA